MSKQCYELEFHLLGLKRVELMVHSLVLLYNNNRGKWKKTNKWKSNAVENPNTNPLLHPRTWICFWCVTRWLYTTGPTSISSRKHVPGEEKQKENFDFSFWVLNFFDFLWEITLYAVYFTKNRIGYCFSYYLTFCYFECLH